MKCCQKLENTSLRNSLIIHAHEYYLYIVTLPPSHWPQDGHRAEEMPLCDAEPQDILLLLLGGMATGFL